MARRLDTKGQYNSAEATEQNITSVLTTVDATNYPATIAGQIDRIGDAHEIIQRKALQMQLKVPAGQGDSKPETTTALTQDHLLMDTAAAINTISINNGATKVLEEGGSYTVPVGYNVREYKISAKTAAGYLTETTLTSSNDLISGLTAYTIRGGKSTKITGQLADYRTGTDNQYKPATSYTNNANTLAVKIPATGAYSSDNYLKTSIRYAPTVDTLSIDVKHAEQKGSNDVALIDDFIIPAGYYPTDKSVPVRVTDNGKNIGEINVEKEKIATGAGDVIPSPGFDYLKLVKIGAAGGFSILDNESRELSVGSYNTATKGYAVTAANVVGKFSTAGWITTADNIDVSTIVGKLPKATFGFTNNIVKSTGAGYIPSGETLLTMSPYTHGMSLVKTTNAISPSGNSTGNVAANHYYVSFNVKTAGYAVTGTHYQDIGSQVSCSDFKTSATSSVTYADKAVNAKTTYLDITGNYQPGAQYIKATVRNASAPTLSITDKTDTVTVGAKNSSGKFPISVSNLTGTISVGTPGWFTGGTATDSSVIVGTLPESVHTCGAIQLGSNINNPDLFDTHCYVPCTTSTGYTLGETKYIDIGAAGTGDTLTTRNYFMTIYSGTYYQREVDISVAKVAGTLRDLSGETNVGITTTTPLENFTSDTTIVGTDDQFLSSVTIEVSGIIDKLSKI